MNDAAFWRKDYPPGVPGEIDPDSVRSLKHMFEDACRELRGVARRLEHGPHAELRANWTSIRAASPPGCRSRPGSGRAIASR